MNNIQKYRGLKGLTQSQLATDLNITRQMLSVIECGKTMKYIRPDVLNKMASILGVSKIKLLGEENFKYLPESAEDVDYLIGLLEQKKESL